MIVTPIPDMAIAQHGAEERGQNSRRGSGWRIQSILQTLGLATTYRSMAPTGLSLSLYVGSFTGAPARSAAKSGRRLIAGRTSRSDRQDCKHTRLEMSWLIAKHHIASGFQHRTHFA